MIFCHVVNIMCVCVLIDVFICGIKCLKQFAPEIMMDSLLQWGGSEITGNSDFYTAMLTVMITAFMLKHFNFEHKIMAYK